MHGDEPVDHRALARLHFLHVDGDGTGHRAEAIGVVKEIGDFRAPDLVLAGQTVGVGTGAADQLALDDGGAMPRPRHVPCQELAAFAAAEDERVNAFRLRHRQLLFLMEGPPSRNRFIRYAPDGANSLPLMVVNTTSIFGSRTHHM
jgi:hypothetical protein